MWCCHCKQDVPAVARSVDGPLVCVLCEAELATPACDALPEESGSLGEVGIELQSLDRSQEDIALPIGETDNEHARQQLRRIGRKLQSSFPNGPVLGTSPALRTDWGHSLPENSRNIRKDRSGTAATKMSWTVSLLLSAGVAGFFGGVGLLVWATLFLLPEAWQWGITFTIAAEGLLIVGLLWMAKRLWSNGRQVNRQLAGVEGQLSEMQQLAGSFPDSRASSASFYHHFSRGVSSPMLVANLRGQMDQLAERISTNG